MDNIIIMDNIISFSRNRGILISAFFLSGKNYDTADVLQE